MTEKKTLKLYGLECQDCAESILKALKRLDGVESVKINFETARCTIEFKSNIITITEIIREVVRLGYRAESEDEKISQPQKKTFAEMKGIILLLIGVLLIAAGFYFGQILAPSSKSLTIGDKKVDIASTFFILAYILLGIPVLKKGIIALVYARSIDTNLLMGIAGLGAIAIKEYAESAVLVFLYALGSYIQTATFAKARKTISSLVDAMPKIFTVKRNNVELTLPLNEVQNGDVITLREGEFIPFDCKIIEGHCIIDESVLTGEFKTFEKGIGDVINAGSYNKSGFVKVSILSAYKDTAVSKIVHLVEEAQERKAKSQQFVEKFAGIYTPIVICVAVLVGFVIPLIFNYDFKNWLERGLTFLVISCPCAFVISVPVCIISAIYNLSRNGVIVKGGTFLEAVGKTDTIFIDKTGTLTEGKYSIAHINSYSNVPENEILRIASSLEQSSNHPVARALREYPLTEEPEVVNSSSITFYPSQGVKGIVNERHYKLGNKKFIESTGSIEKSINLSDECKSFHTTIFLASNGTIIGSICFVDKIRLEAKDTFRKLKELGIDDIKIFSGDSSEVVKKVTQEIGVVEFRGEMKPEEKAVWVLDEMKKSKTVIAVGDGLNDASALSNAEVGIAMISKGQDITVESADVVLIGNDISKLPLLIKVGRKTASIIKKNIFASIFVKIIFFALNSIGYANMWMAVAADMGISILVTLNGLRLLGKSKVHQH